MKKRFHIVFQLSLLAFALLWSLQTFSQGGLSRRIPRPGSVKGAGQDSLQHRDAFADSITITYRYLDSSKLRGFDSSISDFRQHFPVPWTHFDLGNVGNPTHSMVFPAYRKSGWDPGFHSYDVYNFNDYDSRFFNTTRPYTELNYQLGSQTEQIIRFIHTQNIRPNWNASFEYRLINSLGLYQNENTNHNNYRLTSWYQGKKKRYQNFLVVVGNKLQSGDNGGIDVTLLDSSAFTNPKVIPSRLGPNAVQSTNFFSSNVTTGTKYTNASYLFRQQYDLGQKDSIVTDSSVIPLFYPRLRLEHTIDYRTYKYRFVNDATANDQIAHDSAYYHDYYGLVDTSGRFYREDYWKELINDFSFYTFPDAKNSQQFFKAGASMQNLTGSFDSLRVTKHYYNFFLHGEYRNKTRNKKWDIEANGNFYVSGYNAGDYDAHINLQRLISKKIGTLELGFGNTNRTPSFNFNRLSNFYYDTSQRTFKKENSTELYASVIVPRLKLHLTGTYTLISNYTYYSTFTKPEQYATLFNVLQLTAQKQFNFGRGWNLKTALIVQQAAGNPPLHVPFLLTRNQIGYDGNLGFKNLLISFGLEFKYYSAYKSDLYSPLLGQFVYQDTAQVKMSFPETSAYLHFRIKSFSAYIRAENLNAFNPAKGDFSNKNIVSPGYPSPGLVIRVGIYWSFVN